MKLIFALALLCFLSSCNSSITNSNLHFSEKDFNYAIVDSVYYVDSGISFDSDLKSRVQGDSLFIFDSKMEYHLLTDSEKELLKSSVECDVCIEQIDYDICGTTFPSGYFLYFDDSKIIRLLEVTCFYQGINEFSKNSACLNSGYLSDSCQNTLRRLVLSWDGKLMKNNHSVQE